MSRNNPRQSIQAALAKSYEAAGGIANASADIGLAISTLSEHTEMPKGKRAGGLGINYVDAFARTDQKVAAVFAQHFAGLAGGVFQPVQSADNVHDLYQCSSHIAKECGEATSAVINAACSERGGELDKADAELDEAIRELLKAKALVAAKRRAAA